MIDDDGSESLPTGMGEGLAHGVLTQLAECLISNQDVAGSNPAYPSKLLARCSGLLLWRTVLGRPDLSSLKRQTSRRAKCRTSAGALLSPEGMAILFGIRSWSDLALDRQLSAW
jgi:hypothetical protein